MKHMQILRATPPLPLYPFFSPLPPCVPSRLYLAGIAGFSFISSPFVKGIQMQWPLCCLLSRLLCLFPLVQNLDFHICYAASFFLKLCVCPLCPLCCDSYGAEEEGECPGHR